MFDWEASGLAVGEGLAKVLCKGFVIEDGSSGVPAESVAQSLSTGSSSFLPSMDKCWSYDLDDDNRSKGHSYGNIHAPGQLIF